MNCTLSMATDALAVEESYVTAPMPVVRVADQLFDEEALHTSFEESLSERQRALQWRQSLLSDASLRSLQCTDALDQSCLSSIELSASTHAGLSSRPRTWRRRLIFTGLALICVMIGFDLMGLLVLHLH